MEKIKKIGTGLLITLGFILMVGVWSVRVAPAITNLVTDAVTLIPQPKINNPIPQCSSCFQRKGLNPVCLSVCIQEVMLRESVKNNLDWLAVK